MKGYLYNRLLSSNYVSYWLILCLDILLSMMGTVMACLIIRHFTPVELPGSTICLIALVSCTVSVISFYVFKTYRLVIRHSTLREQWRFGAAAVMKIGLICVAMPWLGALLTSQQIIVGAIFDLMFTLIALATARIAMLILYDYLMARLAQRGSRILIYGVGDKSVSMATRLRNNPSYGVAGFYTFGLDYKSYRLGNLPVYYFRNEADFRFITLRYKIESILFPDYESARAEQDRLIRYCEKNKVKVLVSPPVDEVSGDQQMRAPIREIRIEDLLGRDEIRISMDEIIANFRNKTIMVTGAAGSIGSELCRQLATFGVEKLVLFDNAETPMHNIRLELEERFPELEFIPIIGDVRLHTRLDYAFHTYRPQIVFHAAAYKHVPLMEENPCEAVLVNVTGSRNVADKCIEYDVEKMIMISTDKAVNPTNVMGCTKRLAEIYVQSLGLAIETGKIAGRTKFVTTRFGNVLGSNGSVIPRFREQIAKGGPVTVTHPEITRFFMTIPEACRLVMEAATMATGTQIFVFDMGKSVKIADMARRMIELAGLEPDKDIKIEYTGLRSGEKLYEEVLSSTENTLPTSHDRIRIAKVREYDYTDACEVTEKLRRFSVVGEIPEMVRLMKRTVPEFKSRNSQFERFDIEIQSVKIGNTNAN